MGRTQMDQFKVIPPIFPFFFLVWLYFKYTIQQKYRSTLVGPQGRESRKEKKKNVSCVCKSQGEIPEWHYLKIRAFDIEYIKKKKKKESVMYKFKAGIPYRWMDNDCLTLYIHMLISTFSSHCDYIGNASRNVCSAPAAYWETILLFFFFRASVDPRPLVLS